MYKKNQIKAVSNVLKKILQIIGLELRESYLKKNFPNILEINILLQFLMEV